MVKPLPLTSQGPMKAEELLLVDEQVIAASRRSKNLTKTLLNLWSLFSSQVVTASIPSMLTYNGN